MLLVRRFSPVKRSMSCSKSRSLKQTSGFTLLEVLLVLAIIGGLMSLATFTSSDDQALNDTRQQARQLVALFEAYRQEAVFQNIDFGLAMDRQEILLLSLLDLNDPQVTSGKSAEELDQLLKNPWQVHETESFHTELETAEPIFLSLILEEEKIDFDDFIDEKDGAKPALYFLSSDEYSPFELELSHEQDPSFIVRVSGDGIGLITTEVERFEG